VKDEDAKVPVDSPAKEKSPVFDDFNDMYENVIFSDEREFVHYDQMF